MPPLRAAERGPGRPRREAWIPLKPPSPGVSPHCAASDEQRPLGAACMQNLPSRSLEAGSCPSRGELSLYPGAALRGRGPASQEGRTRSGVRKRYQSAAC